MSSEIEKNPSFAIAPKERAKQSKIDVRGFFEFRNRMAPILTRNEPYQWNTERFSEMIQQVGHLPCRQHGYQNIKKFDGYNIDKFVDAVEYTVKRDYCILEEHTNCNKYHNWFISKSKLPKCQDCKYLNNSNAIECESCFTKDPTRFPNKPTNGIGKTQCKLCKAVHLRPVDNDVKSNLYEQHLKLCHIKEEQVVAHKEHLADLELKIAIKKAPLDPYDYSSDEE